MYLTTFLTFSQFEPYLHNSLAIAHTHHFVMHACYKDPDSGTLLSDAMKGFIVDTGFSGNVCYGSDRNVSRLRELCREYVYVWAKGGTVWQLIYFVTFFALQKF